MIQYIIYFLSTFLMQSGAAFAQDGGRCGDGDFDASAPTVSFSEYDSQQDSVRVILDDNGGSGILAYRITDVHDGQSTERVRTFVNGLTLDRLTDYPSHVGRAPTYQDLNQQQELFLKGIKAEQVAPITIQATDGCGFYSTPTSFDYRTQTSVSE